MKRILALPALTLCLSLAGCMATYVPAPDEPTATVRVIGAGIPRMCSDGKRFSLPEAPGVPDGVIVPAGHRITLGVDLSSAGYNVIYFCQPFLSFIPYGEHTYVMHGSMVAQGRCAVEVAQENQSGNNGLMLEYTMGRGQCTSR